jgi:hypothetical protein
MAAPRTGRYATSGELRADEPVSDKPSAKQPDSSTTDRWWVETTPKQRPKETRPAGPAGSSFFTVAHDFEQDRARDRLTDNNLKLLQQANPPDGGWGYVQLTETKFPARELDRIKQLINLPAYTRAAIVDSGRTIRILATGTPVGERILDLTLSDSPSFDCWINGDWVREATFDDAKSAVKAFRKFLAEYLSPEGIAQGNDVAARV